MSEQTALQPQVKASWLFWTLAAFAIFAAVGAYSARMTQDFTDYDQDRAAQRYDTLKKLQDEATKTLTTAAWVDQNKGTVRIPIDEAMSREVDTQKAKPAAMGAPLPGAAPAKPAAAPAPATSAPVATNAAPSAPSTPQAKPATPGAKAKKPTK